MDLQREEYKMANGQNANDFFNNPFNQYTGDMLEYKPELAYYSSPAAKTFAKSPSRRQYFQRSFGDIYNQYLGKLGEESRLTGSAPTLRFQDFLDPTKQTRTLINKRLGLADQSREFLKDEPFTKRYTSMTPEMRGAFGSERARTSAPSTRFIYF